MKGIVFTEFIKMVEEKFGLTTIDEVIENSSLKSNGVYTAVGTYDHSELISMVVKLSELTAMDVNELLEEFGLYTFNYFTDKYSALFANVKSPIEFIGAVEDHIHVEVRKLYPDAELPKFDVIRSDEDFIEMNYQSYRRLSSFAKGLIRGCGNYFNTPLEIKTTDLSGGQGTEVKFEVTIQKNE